jgi:signal transduction histidine kinase
VVLASLARRDMHFGVPRPLAVAAAVLAVAPVAVRRRWPMSAFGVVLAANVTAIVSGAAGDPAIAVALVVYTVAVSGPRRRSAVALAVAVALVVSADAIALLAGRPTVEWPTAVNVIAASALLMAGAWTIGVAVREQRAQAARTARDLTRRAVADERLRIARELHDIIAHSMSLITMKAGVAAYLLDTRPQDARPALALIEATGREALAEMRRIVGAMRGDPGTAGDDTDWAPAPGVAELPALAHRARQAGVRVELAVRATRELPEGTALTVYRIVQEALTNVAKHAAPATCEVRVDIGADEVTIEITDDGPGQRVPPAVPGGHGLIGMRERVHLYGGRFSAGTRAVGGYRVIAAIPVAAPHAVGAARDRKAPA